MEVQSNRRYVVIFEETEVIHIVADLSRYGDEYSLSDASVQLIKLVCDEDIANAGV